MARPTKLTPEVQKTIVAHIRSGAFDWVAAEAAGISARTFRRWMQEGEQEGDEHHDFYEEVRKARAEARVTAEVEVRKDNPLAWLRYGPGREKPGEPGWTDSRQISGPDGGPIPLEIGDARNRLASRLDALAERREEGKAAGERGRSGR